MGTDMWELFKQMFGQGQEAPDIAKPSTMNNLLPENSLLDGGALASANKIGLGAQPAAGYKPTWMDQMTGYTGKDGMEHNGWGGLALGAGQGILGGWMGMQQLDQAKQQLGESKRQFNKNFEANRSMTNTSLEDRQKARVASNAGAYDSVGSYMKKHGV